VCAAVVRVHGSHEEKRTDLGLWDDDVFQESVAYRAGHGEHSVDPPRVEPHHGAARVLHPLLLVLSVGLLGRA
jgi:hypothetical protein